MNQYTEILYYFKALGLADPLVNTVTQGEWSKLDLNDSNIFPLLHINVSGGNFTNGQTVIFNIQLGAYATRQENKEVVSDKFWKQDNEVDNLNETFAILNRIWTRAYRDFDDNNFTASENPTIEPQYEAKGNVLDGWVLSFDLEVPNTTLNLCQ